MIPRPDARVIVLAGAWNPRIFTPAWLAEHIFQVTEIAIEFPDQSGLPYRYSANDVRITPGTNQVALAPLSSSDQALAECERQAVALLRTLVHTPVAAVGTNFGFFDETPGGDLLRLFSHVDETDLATAGYTIEARELKRLLSYEGGDVNLRLAYSQGQVHADFNFHRQVRSSAEAAAVLDGTTLALQQRAVALLEATYHLDVVTEAIQ